jgi:hypothetical protein
MYNKTCNHEERGEIEHMCNDKHNAAGDHQECNSYNCRYDVTDCPHIFALQLCDCGQKFVGKLGEYHKDTTEYLEEKI